MKILRMKITPRPESAITEISFYSCPDTKGNALKTLAFVQRVADKRNVACDYELTDERTYWATRGARMWLISEPGDVQADRRFKHELTAAGILPSKDTPCGIVCTGEDDYRVQVITETMVTTIDTRTGAISETQLPKSEGQKPAVE